jgi:hypothetical protein
MRKMKGGWKILVSKSEGKKPLGKARLTEG